jgi:hypothetical protein
LHVCRTTQRQIKSRHCHPRPQPGSGVAALAVMALAIVAALCSRAFSPPLLTPSPLPRRCLHHPGAVGSALRDSRWSLIAVLLFLHAFQDFEVLLVSCIGFRGVIFCLHCHVIPALTLMSKLLVAWSSTQRNPCKLQPAGSCHRPSSELGA